jgi:hypothetical protein
MMLPGFKKFISLLPRLSPRNKREPGILIDGLTNPDFVYPNTVIANIFHRQKAHAVYFIDTNTPTSRLYHELGFQAISFSAGTLRKVHVKALLAYVRDRYLTRKIDPSSDILDFHIEGVRVGDLLIDTVQRFDAVKKFDLDFTTGNFPGWIKLTYYQFYLQKQILKEYPLEMITLSHKYYIYYGLLPRIALKKGISSLFISCNSLFRMDSMTDLYLSEHHFSTQAWDLLDKIGDE